MIRLQIILLLLLSSFVIVIVIVNGFVIQNTNVQSKSIPTAFLITTKTNPTRTTQSSVLLVSFVNYKENYCHRTIRKLPFLLQAITDKNSNIQNNIKVENEYTEYNENTDTGNDEIITILDKISSSKSNNKNHNQKNNNNYYVALEVFGSPSTIVSADSISSRTYRLQTTSPAASTTSNSTSVTSFMEISQSISQSIVMPIPVLQIQIGNVSIGRKAWKKRRRSTSPLLVPCSILSITTYDAIRSNIIHIIQKYGHTTSTSTTGISSTNTNTVVADNTNVNNEHYNDQHTVQLSISNIIQRYETQFGRRRQRSETVSSSSVLQVHATEYGFTDVSQFIVSMFGQEHSINNDNTFSTVHDNDIYIQSSLSKYKAQKRVQNSVLLQFTSTTSTSTPPSPLSTTTEEIVDIADIDKEVTTSIPDGTNTELYHTGFIRTRTKLKSSNNGIINDAVGDHAADADTDTDTASTITLTTDTASTTTATTGNNNNNNKYYYTYNYTPLSVAVRLSQEDVDSHYVTDNSIHSATIFAYDPHGDAGSPLITLSIARGGVPVLSTTTPTTSTTTSTSTTIASNSSPKNNGNNEEEDNLIINTNKKQKIYKIQDLKTGHKVKGTVVRLIKGGAIIDCNVISTTGSSTDDTMTQKKVFGFISFKDAYVPFKPVQYGSTSTRNNNNNRKNTSRRQFDQIDDNEEYDDDDDDVSDKVWSLNDLDTMDDDDEDEDDDVDEDDDDEETDSKIQQMLDNIDLSELEDDDDDTDVEDVTHLCVQNEDGSFTYTDPETGISEVVFAEFDHDHDHDDDDDDDDDENVEDDEEGEDTTNEIKSNKDNTISTTGSKMETTITNYWNNQNNKPIMKRQQLHRGDTMTFYIKYVPKVNQQQQQQQVGSTSTSSSRSSNQFTVTLDSSIQGKDNKDIKYEKELSKKLSRLSNQLGGSLNYLQSIQGKESIGIVQATSNTKNNNSNNNTWLYVQPTGIDYKQLPVGIATIATTTTSTSAVNQQQEQYFTKGDTVRIVFTGIDAQRGQLAMQILEKITTTGSSNSDSEADTTTTTTTKSSSSLLSP